MARELLAHANHAVTHRTASTKQHRNRPMQPAVKPRSRRTRRQTPKRPQTDTGANTIEGAFTGSFRAPETSAPDTPAASAQLSPLTQVQAPMQINSVKSPLAKRLLRPIASERRTRQYPVVVKPSTDRPAIAKSGSSNRVVVISPEEARRAREHAAQDTPKPRLTRIIPSSGRLAFEALFRDETDLSRGT